jgi:thioredoxin reductase (NADPH)
MSHYLIVEIEEQPNISVLTQTEVAALHGTDHLEAVTLANKATGAQETVAATALFIFIGALPCTDWLSGVVERDAQGFILSGEDLRANGQRPQRWTADRDPYLLETSVPGIFVAGDVRHNSVKRVASAVGEGAMAVMFMHQYLRKV